MARRGKPRKDKLIINDLEENIIVQLKKTLDLGGFEVIFENGTKEFVTPLIAKDALNRMSTIHKSCDKLKFQQFISYSKENLESLT